MKYAIIENNKVVNVAVSEAPLAENWILSHVAVVGDTYNPETGEFTKPEPPPEPVPAKVSKRQAKQQLLIAGLLANVQPAIDAVPDATQKALTQIYWDDSQEFERNHQTLISLATTSLGLTNQQLDELFKAASKL